MPSTATHLQLLPSPERDAASPNPGALDHRAPVWNIDGTEIKLPIRVVIEEPEMLRDVVDGLDDAVNYAPGDGIRYLQAREQLVQLMDRAIHRESDLEVRYMQLLAAARAEIAQTGDATEHGPLVHLRHALAAHGQLPPAGVTPAQLLAQAVTR